MYSLRPDLAARAQEVRNAASECRYATSNGSLPARLAVVLASVPPEMNLVDIGTDHGLLPEAHCLRANAEAIGVDRSRPALEAAKRRLANVDRRPRLLLSDALTEFTPFTKPTAITFAGIGGETIAAMLHANAPVVRSARLLVIQANRDEDRCRAAAIALGFGESTVRLLWNGRRLFVTSVFRRLCDGGTPLCDRELYTGRAADIEPAGLMTLLAESRVGRLGTSIQAATRGGDWRKAEQLAHQRHAWHWVLRR